MSETASQQASRDSNITSRVSTRSGELQLDRHLGDQAHHPLAAHERPEQVDALGVGLDTADAGDISLRIHQGESQHVTVGGSRT